MTEPRTVEFFGDTYALNDDVSQFALLEFAKAASEGQDGDTMEGLASMLRLVEECIAPADVVTGDGTLVGLGVKRFLGSARRNKAGADDLVKVIQVAFGDQAERPTERPSGSAGGPSTTQPRSVSNSDVKVSEPSPTAGRIRPDLALVLETRAS